MIDEAGILDFELDIDDDDMDFFSFTSSEEKPESETRYIKPLAVKNTTALAYKNASKLAKVAKLGENERFDAFVSGDFVFGDFLFAYLYEHRLKANTVTISTLGLNEHNIISLAKLMEHGYINNLNLIVSRYFYAHEKFKLVPKIYQHLDIEERFQLCVVGSHTKIITFDTIGGGYYVVHGSANLRSSDCVEQFTFENNKQIYDFYNSYHESIVKRFYTIDHDKKLLQRRGARLWAEIHKDIKAERR